MIELSNLLEVNLITMNRDIINIKAQKIITKNEEGVFEILANHVPMISSTIPTETIIYDENNNKRELFTSEGILYIDNNKVDFCCNSVEWPEEIDLQRSIEAKERAEKRIDSKENNIDIERARRALARANTRIYIKEQ